MFRSAQTEEVLASLRRAMSALDPARREALERALIAPRLLGVEDCPGEYVVAVAEIDRKLLYWSDVEEGWELETPSEGGTIPTRGCNQFELEHVLHQIFRAAGAV